jgi:hypothetical protein
MFDDVELKLRNIVRRCSRRVSGHLAFDTAPIDVIPIRPGVVAPNRASRDEASHRSRSASASIHLDKRQLI